MCSWSSHEEKEGEKEEDHNLNDIAHGGFRDGLDVVSNSLTKHRTLLFSDGKMQSEQVHRRKNAKKVAVAEWVNKGTCVVRLPAHSYLFQCTSPFTRILLSLSMHYPIHSYSLIML